MACNGCQCVVGNFYTLHGGFCTDCGTPVATSNSIARYEGIQNGVHWFKKTNPVRCSGCGIYINRHQVKCEDGERDLELEKFFGINQSHWVGR